MEDIERIKDRIAKLLAMAADSSSPEEAAIAARRARSLMDRYQIEAWEVEKEVQEVMVRKPATRVYAAVPQHLSFLATAVAQYNDCQSRYVYGEVTHRMSSKRGPAHQKNVSYLKVDGYAIEFCGYETDVQLAVDMFTFLTGAADRACKEYLKDKGYAKYPVKVGTAFKQAFVHKVTARLKAMTAERDELTATSTGTSLVVLKSKAVEDHFGEVKYKEKALSATIDHETIGAFREGARQGSLIEIVKSVE